MSTIPIFSLYDGNIVHHHRDVLADDRVLHCGAGKRDSGNRGLELVRDVVDEVVFDILVDFLLTQGEYQQGNQQGDDHQNPDDGEEDRLHIAHEIGAFGREEEDEIVRGGALFVLGEGEDVPPECR